MFALEIILAFFKQDELNIADSEVDTQKRGKRHYEEKQKEHLNTLNKKKRELDMKEKELEVIIFYFTFLFTTLVPIPKVRFS